MKYIPLVLLIITTLCGVKIYNDINSNPLMGRQIIGKTESLLAPGFGTCYRCNHPWSKAEAHVTDYIELSEATIGQGCFPLCEQCWSELTPKTRLPFYKKLVNDWGHDETWGSLSEHHWDLIKKAVLEGK